MAGIQVIHVKCFLRYQQHDIQHGDEMILVATSNHAGGTTVLVVQEDKSGNPQSYLKVIGNDGFLMFTLGNHEDNPKNFNTNKTKVFLFHFKLSNLKEMKFKNVYL